MEPLILRTEPRWRWVAAWGVALAGLLVLVLLPGSWWEAIWPRGRLRPVAATEAAATFTLVEPARVRPPRGVVARPDSSATAVADPVADAAWWDRAWQAKSREADIFDEFLPATVPVTR